MKKTTAFWGVVCALGAAFALAGAAQADSVTQVDFGSIVGGTNGLTGETADAVYGDVITPGSATYTPHASVTGGYFDAAEPTWQGGGSAPAPDTTFTLYITGPTSLGTFNAVEGFEEGLYTVGGLIPNLDYKVGVTISELDALLYVPGVGFVPAYTDAGLTQRAVETVFVSGNGSEIGSVAADPSGGNSQLVTSGWFVGTTDGSGNLTIDFNEIFTWPVGATSAPLPGSQSGIRVEQIRLTPTPEPPALALMGILLAAGLGLGLRRKLRLTA